MKLHQLRPSSSVKKQQQWKVDEFITHTYTATISFPQSHNQLQTPLHSYHGGSDAITSSSWVSWSSWSVYIQPVCMYTCLFIYMGVLKYMLFEWDPLYCIFTSSSLSTERNTWLMHDKLMNGKVCFLFQGCEVWSENLFRPQLKLKISLTGVS